MTVSTEGTPLLDLEMTTDYVRSADGRLERERRRAPEPVFAPPLVSVACGAGGMVWACATSVPLELVAEVDALLSIEPVVEVVPGVGWSPQEADSVLARVTSLAGGARIVVGTGPSFVAPTAAGSAATTPEGVELRSNVDTDLASIAALLPERDAVLDPPWVVAIVDGVPAAVCETARSAPSSVEAGVWTYDPHRRRGLATLVTSAWLDLVTPERTAFYSTSADNVGSQGVARRLGLTPLAQWWQVRTATP